MKKNDINIIDIISTYGDISELKFLAYYNDELGMTTYSFSIDGKSTKELLEFLDKNYKCIHTVNRYEDDSQGIYKYDRSGYNELGLRSLVDNYVFRKVYTTPNKDAIAIFIDTGIGAYCHKLIFAYMSKSEENHKKLVNYVLENHLYVKKKENISQNFYQIGIIDQTPRLYNLKLKDVKIDDYYYNNDIDIPKLIDIINSDKSGLILFSGIPGSGKTSLIKYLSNKTEKKFCNLPNENLNILNAPSYLGFAVHDLKDAVIIIEDCEKLLASRKSIRNEYISTILNIGDGLLGNALNLKIIMTFNSDDNIDPAILRKGRTLYHHKFGKLTPENATKVSVNIGANILYTEPIILCDVFNIEDNGVINTNKKIGF
jgi:hypothetical protein